MLLPDLAPAFAIAAALDASTKARRSRLAPGYTYDAALGRYRNAATGRLVSGLELRAVMDAVMNGAAARMGDLMERFIAGQIDLATLAREMMQTIKNSHLAATAAGRGGWGRLGPQDFGRLGFVVKNQYGYLRRFVEQIMNGTAPLDGRAIVRARMYGHAARGTFEQNRRGEMSDKGFTHEKRIRTAFESCVDCIEYEARGWRPIGTLPVISDSVCLTNCRCYFEFKKVPAPDFGATAPEPKRTE